MKVRMIKALQGVAISIILVLAACGGGSGSGGSLTNTPSEDDPSAGTDPSDNPSNGGLDPDPDGSGSPSEGGEESSVLDPFSDTATYNITVRNFWGVDEFPQFFPDGAHLSLWGGATHNAAFSFWDLGETPSKGLEDVAEAGLIDILLNNEVGPAIKLGTADSTIDIRTFTDAAIDGEPGILEFSVSFNRTHPLLSMVSMLGPSPDWFVGVSGESMMIGEGDDTPAWLDRVVFSMPLYDGGSKSDVTPVMGGPDIIPPNPVAYVAYDPTTGTYQPSDAPQNVGELLIERIR